MFNLREKLIGWLSGWLTDEEIFRLAADTFTHRPDSLEKEWEETIYEDLSRVENIDDYLRSLMFQDMRRYFSASTPMEQQQIKGMYSRSVYMKGRIEKARQDDGEEGDDSNSGMNIPRYWSQ